MLVPILRKIVHNQNSYVERQLPVEGKILVSKGDTVKPFDRIGECVFSQNRLNLSLNFKPSKDYQKDKSVFFYAGTVIGKIKNSKIQAPYNGNLLFQEETGYYFEETESRFNLLSGVWGEVYNVKPGHSVLVKANTKNILLAASTDVSIFGELVVFPNPTEILEKYYLESFIKNTKGKIIYIGHGATIEALEKAYDMGVGAVISGSAEKKVFIYAKSKNMGFGIISGFGKTTTPDEIYDFINLVGYRHVFFEGDRNILKIPVPSDSHMSVGINKETIKTSIRDIKINDRVCVFQKPHFGMIGVVDRVGEFSIFVKFDEKSEGVEIFYPNFCIYE